MAAYGVVDWVSVEGTLAVVAAAIEVKLETLDSTNNPLYISKIFPIGRTVGPPVKQVFQACIIYKG